MTKIVVADDHQIVREGLVKLLESRADFEVVGQAADGLEAVELVLQTKPDLVLMDILMPKISGIDATRRLQKEGCTAKILVLSMNENRASVEEVLRAGASGYIVKNATSKELLNAIDAVRSGDSYLSPTVTRQVVDAIANPGDKEASGMAMLTGREREVLDDVDQEQRRHAQASTSNLGSPSRRRWIYPRSCTNSVTAWRVRTALPRQTTSRIGHEGDEGVGMGRHSSAVLPTTNGGITR